MANYTDIPIINRATEIIGNVIKTPQGVSAAQLQKKMSVPKTTFYRILNSLVHNGYLCFDSASNLYYLGKLFDAPSILDDDRIAKLRDNAMPIMQDLVNSVQETVKLSILSNMDCYVLLKVEGAARLRISVDIGTLFPLHAGAASKILMSTLPPVAIHRYFSKTVEKFTPLTILSEKQMIAELDDIRACGYSIDKGEFIQGIRAIACPVCDENNYVIAAISVAYPVLSLEDDIEGQLLPKLKVCASSMSKIW